MINVKKTRFDREYVTQYVCKIITIATVQKRALTQPRGGLQMTINFN